MSSHAPLIRDVLPLLRDQLTSEVVTELFLLAVEDPATFLLEVLASAKAGRLDLPTAVVGALEEEVSRMSGAPDHAAAPTAPPTGTDLDPLVHRQRRIDAVAQQVRERLDRRDQTGNVPPPRAARPAVVLNKAGLDPR